MKISKFLSIGFAFFLAACNITSLPAEDAAPTIPAAVPKAETTALIPSETLSGTVSPALPPVPVVYYYFVDLTGKAAPAGSVVILQNELVLGPALSKAARSPDAITNVSSALQAMLLDPRNAWTGTNLGIANIMFDDGKAEVALQGEIHGAGDVVLIAARMQILMTVFAESSVQAALVTLDGENIANLGISHSSEARTADYSYPRIEIETFMQENAYNP